METVHWCGYYLVKWRGGGTTEDFSVVSKMETTTLFAGSGLALGVAEGLKGTN